MDYSLRFLVQFVLIWGPALSNVFFAQGTGTMSGASEDASDITWAHAVNSKSALEKALGSPVDFLEADISMGHTVSNERTPPIPIMAHPPNATSDISLEDWLNTVAKQRPDKGLKLDFKSIEAVEPSLQILEKYTSQLKSSVWLNADVLSGPVDSPAIPVQVEQFLAKCQQYFPNATLSVGWTTQWYPTFDRESWQYGWKHVRKMADVIRCSGYENTHLKFTFPVRAIFASRSIKKLQWLLSVVPDSTLTIWSGKFDILELEDLLRIRSSFPKHKVYYDVPDSIHKMFQKKKNSVKIPISDTMTKSSQWMVLTSGQSDSCSALTDAGSDIVVFGRSLTTAALNGNLLEVNKDSILKISGRVKFFSTDDQRTFHSSRTFHEVMIVLAEVSSFAKNMTEESKNELDLASSDTDVIWTAINSSIIYTFRHDYLQEGSSCRFFKLDTSADKSFEAWTVPCDTMLEEYSSDELAKSGKQEISSRKRLVLPEGPFMFGVVSSGDEHVVIFDLDINGKKEKIISGAKSTFRAPLGPFSLLITLLSFPWILFRRYF